MKKTLLFIFSFLTLSLCAQDIKFDALSNGGGRISNVNSTSFSIGQPFVGTISNGNSIRQGFQQPSFTMSVPGCMDASAINYNPLASIDDGSCIIICVASECCISGTQWDLNTMTCVYEDACSADIAKDGFVAVDDLLELLSAFGSSCEEVATGIGGEECLGAECCGENTIWCETLEICIPFISCPADLNEDESVGVDDLLTFLISYGGACEEYESLPDCEVTYSPWMCGDLIEHEGYDYSTVQIGEQCWFSENCRYLPEVSPSSAGSSSSSPYYYVYDYEGTDVEDAKATENYVTYGVLYNWPAVMTEGVCPTSWHIPSDAEWMTLEMYLGMSEYDANTEGYRGTDEGDQMKSTSGWANYGNGSNSSGLTALPGGLCRGDACFNKLEQSNFWSSSSQDGLAWMRDVVYDYSDVTRNNWDTSMGFSARCIKD
jgi:uncharacterized protein (TIGR02145 family)